jgi:hypothetical protein
MTVHDILRLDMHTGKPETLKAVAMLLNDPDLHDILNPDAKELLCNNVFGVLLAALCKNSTETGPYNSFRGSMTDFVKSFTLALMRVKKIYHFLSMVTIRYAPVREGNRFTVDAMKMNKARTCLVNIVSFIEVVVKRKG